MATRPSEPEHLPCPRCDSTNTKFCYYNNYNLSQPRHFCKSCRRYWTRGGTLRNVPVGGGSRKSSSSSSNKRPRTNPTSTSTSTSSTAAQTAVAAATCASSSSDMTHDPLHASPVSMVSQMGSAGSGSLAGCEVNLNEAVPEAASFSSLLTTQVGAGYLPFGSGFGPGLHGVGFGLGMMDWPMESVGQGNGTVGAGVGGGENGRGGDGGVSGGGGGNGSGCNTWQLGGVEGGIGDGDCFGWPDLAISMPGKGLK